MNLKEYQKQIEVTWISNYSNLIRIILGIGGESGEIQELFKKYYRGDIKTPLSLRFLIPLKKEIGDLMYYIAKLCNCFDFDMEEILDDNIKKLAKRKQENKIKGSGSNR